MKGIHNYLQSKKEIQSIVGGIKDGITEQLAAGLSGSARSLFVSIIQESLGRPVLLITHQLVQAQQLYDDLSEFINGRDVYLYPVNEMISSEVAISSPELRAQRIESLTEWSMGNSGILIAPVAALKRILPPKNYWEYYQLEFTGGKSIHIEEYLTSLISMGYERTSMVTSPGEFSIRGGIIDIYPMTKKHPVRIELFDQEVDSIRYFDADTQRSLEKLNEITIGPATDLLLTTKDMTTGSKRLMETLTTTLKGMGNSQEKEELIQAIDHDVNRLKEAQRFQGIYKYIGFLYEEPASLLDYLPEDGIIIFDEMSRIQETATNLDREESEWYSSLVKAGQMVGDKGISFEWADILGRINHQRIYMSVFMRHIANTDPQNIVNLSIHDMQEFHGQMNLFKSELERWEKNKLSVVILASDEERASKVHSILADYQIRATLDREMKLPVTEPTIIVGNLRNGMELPLYKLVLITDHELFTKKPKRVRRRQNISNAERIKNYQELKVGDYVVHESHGVGKYLGIETIEVNKLHKDYLLIKYSGDDRLFVPIDQIDLVQKFVGSEGKEPKVYKLGGSEWGRVKSKAQSSVEDIADDLIKLYAEREARKGYAFSDDTTLQREFEATFSYQETDDQLRCIEEIKEDMEKRRPMDRLLCGDVGYGKTEVAIRAAFKAIADGKQVAFLVPTTILAQQHYQTIIERFQDHAVEVGLLSRFRTAKQQRDTLQGLKRGTVDIVIGTHRLLSKDVVYEDLGLLIVDEEQRFGVKHKERLKQLKTNVDVLTLTATPIPRTLHMSMLGVRDLSVIETPPENRFPIQTYVMEYNPMFVKEAIEREMSRGGQVFFLHNRVENIDEVARSVGMLVDGARIAVAHGQMNESELEHIILGFLENEFDVLVSTTIIETGVDIPNVNTLIVNDADHMGLSQLYQLRGRVGRSNRVAYAYFTYKRDKVLTEVAEKRLQAIKEFTELGSGFKIAMRDLSIRGAGNLLGSQQHGFIDSVGFDMYSQMLKDAIDARKAGKELDEMKPFEPKISLDVDAYIPETYIGDEKQKIDMYKQFQTAKGMDDIEDLKDELIDRFGDYPKEVEHLLAVSIIRLYATRERVESIYENKQKIELLMDEVRSQQVDGTKLFELAQRFGRNVQLGTEQSKLKISLRISKETRSIRYQMVGDLIEELANVDRNGKK